MHGFAKILHIEIRNLDESPVVVSSSYFVPDKIKMHPNAHRDSITRQYEIKYRLSEFDVHSQVTVLLRHRDIVTSYVPISTSQSEESLDQLSRSRQIGTLHCLITEFREKERPKTTKHSWRLANIEHYEHNTGAYANRLQTRTNNLSSGSIVLSAQPQLELPFFGNKATAAQTMRDDHGSMDAHEHRARR
jgi:hypothetical protein